MHLGLSLGIGQQYGGFQIPMIGTTPSFAGVDFTGGVVQTWGDFGFNLQRLSGGTLVNSAGSVVSVPANTPRLQSVGGNRTALLMEIVRTRINSDTVATQGVTVTAQPYTLSFYGAGSVALSGAHSATLAGTGASDRVVLTFTPTAGTLTLTPTGDVRLWQVEAGSPATSYIAGAGANVTRQPDLSNSALAAAIQTAVASGYWIFAQGAVLIGNIGAFDRVYQLDNGDINNRHSINYLSAPANIGSFMFAAGVAQTSSIRTVYTLGTKINIANKFAGNDFVQIWGDGTVQTDTSCLYVAPNVLRIAAGDSASSNKPAIVLIEKLYFGAPSISQAVAESHRSAMP